MTSWEEGVVDGIAFFSWYDSYCVESWGMNHTAVGQIAKWVWIIKHIWTERKECWRLKNEKLSFHREKGLSNSESDSLYIPSMSTQQLQQ